MYRHIRWFCLAVVGVLMTGSVGFAQEASKPFIVDLLMGEPVSFTAMLDDLAGARIVYLGEIHTIARHHQLQTKILEGLAERGLRPAVGMEMFSQAQQPILDRWQQGREDLSSLFSELGHERWGNLKDYESILLTARRLNIPIVGLNASDKLVRNYARRGFEGLSDEEKKDVPEDLEQLTNPLNARLLRLRLRVHKAFQHGKLDRIVAAQTLRDETMAKGVVDFLNSPQGKDRLMLVIAGNGHVNYGLGIPERVRARLDVPYRIVLASESGELVLSKEEELQSVPIHTTHEELSFIRLPIADYLQVIPDEGKTPPADAIPTTSEARVGPDL